MRVLALCAWHLRLHLVQQLAHTALCATAYTNGHRSGKPSQSQCNTPRGAYTQAKRQE